MSYWYFAHCVFLDLVFQDGRKFPSRYSAPERIGNPIFGIDASISVQARFYNRLDASDPNGE
jgi:hypothetical protein